MLLLGLYSIFKEKAMPWDAKKHTSSVNVSQDQQMIGILTSSH